MDLVAGLDFGGSAVKACIAEIGSGDVLATAEAPTPRLQPAVGRDEFEPDAWWDAATTAMRAAVAGAAAPPSAYGSVTVTSLRQGYVLLDASGELGRGVLNSDRRGAAQLERVRSALGPDRLYQLTGHWSAPQLTLPKLLQEAVDDPRGWARVETVLFVHDWALWRLCGVRTSEPTMASAGQLLDIRRRAWAEELISSVGLDVDMLPPLRDPGSVLGELRDAALGLPVGIPVVVGGADTQVAAAGAGGLAAGAVTVVAGSTTPLQATASEPVADPRQHPWVSAHLVPGRWALETNAGYTGMSFDWLASLAGLTPAELADEAAASSPGARGVTALVTARTWSEDAWSSGVPNALVGFDTQHRRGDLARAFLEAHAYGIRGNLEDLERVLGSSAERVCLTGGAARSPAFCQLVADVSGRAVSRVDREYPAGAGLAWLASLADDPGALPPPFSGDVVEPRDAATYEDGYGRFAEAGEAVRRSFAGWAG